MMFEKLFEAKKAEINKTLEFVLNSKYSEFYQKNLKGINLPLTNYEEFQKIPLLNKEDILNTKIINRLHIPESEIDFFSMSSGTTNINKPMIMPQKLVRFEEIGEAKTPFNLEFFSKIGLRNLMLIIPTFSGAAHMFFKQNWGDVTPIIADPANLELMALLANEISLEGIISSPTGVSVFASKLSGVGYDFNKLKLLILTGEICTNSKLEEIRNIFPNAYIDFVYGAAESLNGMTCYGKRCLNMKEQGPTTYHPANHTFFIELLDDENMPVKEGEIGQIVITDLYFDRALPFIRYKLGDYAFFKKVSCPCGNGYYMTLAGRGEFDILKIQGTTLTTDKIESSIKSVKEYLKPEFQAHVYEDNKKGKVLPRLEIHLILKNEYKTRLGLKELIQKEISENLHISSSNTMSSLVKSNIFQPLVVHFVEKIQATGNKTKNIISHL